MGTDHKKTEDKGQLNRFHPVIVVVAFNRPRSLERILNSLLQVRYAEGVELIISIDNQAPNNYPVRDIAQRYEWPFGEKEVIYRSEHLGLRNHILKCGDLSEKYGSVIILEDDLFVSPYMYNYAVKALEYYDSDNNIGGVSLYHQPINEMVLLPFAPINDDSDVHFIQFPSSWGQAWTKKHWKKFREWYDEMPDISTIIHKNILSWPETSWKKYFAAYLISHNKYFVFPRYSFTTNFNDPGTHLKTLSNFEGQVHLRLFDGPYRFKKLSESYCVYDSTLELLPEKLKYLSSGLEDYDFEMDLYGLKDPRSISKPYMITSKPSRNPMKGYKRALKPHEMNIIFDLRGDEFSLCRKNDVLLDENNYDRKLADYKYFYTRNIPGWKLQTFNYLQRLKQKIKH